MHPAFTCLHQRNIHDLFGDALDLDIHLQRGDALLCTGYLEIHVAKVIFVAQDVGEHRKTVAFLDQTHRNARDMRLERYAGIHQRKTSSTDGRHRTRSVRLRNFGNQTHRIGEFIGRRQYREQSPLGKTAVPDFAAFGRTHATRFTGRIRRKVVMQHESFGVFALQRVDDLLVACGAQRCDCQCLGFAAREQYRPVRSRKHAGAYGDRPHSARIATVDARLAAKNLATDDLGFDIAENRLHEIDVVGLRSGGCGFRQYLGARRLYFLGSGLFLAQAVGLAQFFFGEFRNAREQSRIFLQRSYVPQRLADFVGKLIDNVNHRLHLLMAVDHCSEHHILRQLHGLGFDHQYCLAGARDNEVELRGF